jgi:hypothetical protein
VNSSIGVRAAFRYAPLHLYAVDAISALFAARLNMVPRCAINDDLFIFEMQKLNAKHASHCIHVLEKKNPQRRKTPHFIADPLEATLQNRL